MIIHEISYIIELDVITYILKQFHQFYGSVLAIGLFGGITRSV